MCHSPNDIASIRPSWDEILEDRAWGYEAAVVRYIVAKCGLYPQVPAMEQFAAHGKLMIEALVEVCNFPLWIVPKRLPPNPNLAADLDQRITKTAVYREFKQIFEDVPEQFAGTGVAGLVFSWVGYGKFKIFHNREPDTLGKSGRFWRIGHDHRLHFMEELSDFLEVLGPPNSW